MRKAVPVSGEQTLSLQRWPALGPRATRSLPGKDKQRPELGLVQGKPRGATVPATSLPATCPFSGEKTNARQ